MTEVAEKTKEVCDLLNSMGIEYRLVQHDAVYTIEDMMGLNWPDADKTDVAKNLFVRDDKKRCYYLLVVREDKKVDLKSVKETVGSRPLSFASENDLMSILGLAKGSVTPLGIIHDEACKVKVMIDDTFRNSTIGVHPNENTATVFLRTADLVNIIEKHGNQVEFKEI